MRWLMLLLYPRLIMSALTDLQAAVAKLGADVASKLSAKDSQIASLTQQLADAQATAGTPDSALVEVTASINAIDATVAP